MILLAASDPQINLPDVVITGERSMKAELQASPIDFSQYTLTDSTMDFKYSTHLQSSSISEPSYIGTEHNGFLRALAGNKRLISFDAMYHDQKRPALIFSADGYQLHLKNKWDQEYAGFKWTPEFGNYMSLFNLRAMAVKVPLSASETEIMNGEIGFGQLTNNEENTVLKDTQVRLSYINSQQDAEKFERLEDLNLFAKTILPISRSIFTQFRYENLNQHPQGVFCFVIHPEKIVDHVSPWLAADKEHLYPSIDFLIQQPLSAKADLFIKNAPYLNQDDILTQFNMNPWQYIGGLRCNELQEKSMLNTKIGFEYHSIYHFAITHQVSYKQYLPMYGNISGKLYSFGRNDWLVQSSEMKMGYGIDKVILETGMTYHQFRCDDLNLNWLSYAGVWENTSKIQYISAMGISTLYSQYKGNRKNHINQRMADLFEVDFKHDFIIHKNVMINVNLYNLLNRKNIRFMDVPWLPFNAMIGGTVTF